MAQPMGIGHVGQPGTIIKRKFRYTIQFTGPWGQVPEHYVKVAARPQLEIDELEVQFLNASTWIPGKGRWQPLNITYIDVAGSEMQGLYDWAATIYDFQKYGEQGTDLPQSERSGWEGTGLLSLYDGCGTPVEKWTLKGCFIQAINFGDLDYSSNDECTIEVTIRYDRASLESVGSCGVKPQGQCKGCNS
jgi:hypothetical protein